MSRIAIVVAYLWLENVDDAETAALPNVVGKARDDAQKILTSEGFKARVETRESPEEDEGTVLEQSPRAGSEAERGSEVALFVGAAPPPEETPPPEEALPPEAASGPAPGYIPVEDPTGSLSMEIPAAWDPITGLDSEEGLSWTSSTGESIQASITAAPDHDAWAVGASGTYAVASRTLAQEHTDEELLSFGPNVEFSSGCGPGTLEDFERRPYSGRMRTWDNCGQYGSTRTVVSAAPPGRDCVLVLQIAIVSEAEVEVKEHILDTFEVNCESVAEVDIGDGGIGSADPDENAPLG